MTFSTSTPWIWNTGSERQYSSTTGKTSLEWGFLKPWDMLPMKHEISLLKNAYKWSWHLSVWLVRWGPARRLGDTQSPLHVMDAVAWCRMLAARKVSSARGCVFQELGVLHKYPTSLNFRSTVLQGIPFTYRHDLIHPLIPSEAGRGPAWLPLLHVLGGKGTEKERKFPKVTQQIWDCQKGSWEVWLNAPQWFPPLPWPWHCAES